MKKNKIVSIVKKRDNITIVLLVPLLLATITAIGYFYLRLHYLESQKGIVNVIPTTNTKEQSNQPEIVIDEDEDITKNWKAYTFEPEKDVDQKIFQYYPTIFIPNFSFKYPSYFNLIRTRSDIYENTDPYGLNPSLKGTRTVGVGFQLKQEEVGSPCSQGLSGPCHGINLEFTLGITPKDLSDFNVDFWGGGNVADRVDRLRINDISVRQAYFYEQSKNYPTTTLFIFSPELQLRGRVFEYECRSVTCQQAKKEIRNILTTLKFADQDSLTPGWKIYVAQNRNFSFEYPSSWTVGSCDGKTIRLLHRGNLNCASEQGSDIIVYPLNTDEQSFLDYHKDNFDMTSKSIDVGSNKYDQVTGYIKKGMQPAPGSVDLKIWTFIPDGNTIYLVGYDQFDKLGSSYQNIYQRVVSTFNFQGN